MKTAFVLLFIILSTPMFAEYIPRNYYVVVSDEKENRIKEGTCLMTGKILDVNDQPVSGGTISNFDRSRSCLSDDAGNYSLLLSVRDTAVFFYHENFGEIVIWKFNFQSQHHTQINFVTMEKSDLPIMDEKPVIYLYADKVTSLNLSLKQDHLTFTYPEYKDGWNVSIDAKNGITNLADGKNYPYLFWEGKSQSLSFKKTNEIVSGSIIETKNVIDFLESSLSSLGLNSTESADFITYWGPRLVEKEFAFVQFLVDEAVDETICDLITTPEVGSRRRIYFLFTLLDSPQVPFNYEQQKFESFERNGVTLLEWGGSELELRNLFQ